MWRMRRGGQIDYVQISFTCCTELIARETNIYDTYHATNHAMIATIMHCDVMLFCALFCISKFNHDVKFCAAPTTSAVHSDE
jgi:hypothetical protein